MTKQDDDVMKVLLGGFFGAVLAAPSQQDKQDLANYKQIQREISERQKKVGDLSYIVKLLKNPLYVKPFTEAYRTYLYGFYRSSVILNAAIIESLLKEKYGNKTFHELIELAFKEGFIDKTEYHLLHSVKSERNYSAHEILREVSEDNAVLVIRIVNKIMYKFI